MNNLSQTTLFSRIALLVVSVTLLLTACGEQITVAPAATSQPSPAARKAATTPAPPAPAVAPASSPAKGPQFKACDLFTPDEAAVILGGPVNVEENSLVDATGSGSCTYSGTNTYTLAIVLNPNSQSIADFEDGAKKFQVPLVPGIGDAAYLQLDQLIVIKGTITVTVEYLRFGAGDATLLADTKTVAQKVLDRLATGGLAGNLTSTVAPSSSKPVTQADIPVYPGATRLNSEDTGIGILSSFTSPDSYEKIVAWYKQTFQDKEWYGSYVMEVEPGYTIASAGKSSNDGAIQTNIVASIYGPKKADRQPRKDENDKPVVLDPGATLIEVLITGNK